MQRDILKSMNVYIVRPYLIEDTHIFCYQNKTVHAAYRASIFLLWKT